LAARTCARLRSALLSLAVILSVQCGGDADTDAPPTPPQTATAEQVTPALEVTGESPGTEAARAETTSEFIRIRRSDDGQMLALETSITRYARMSASADPTYVDLIGAVHMAEPEYYAALNQELSAYDVVLYELVAPEGARIPDPSPPEEDLNPVSGMQTLMSEQLELAFQLDYIDYTAVNFVHADMSPREFADSMAANDESLGAMFLRVFAHSMSSWRPSTDISFALAYLSNNRAMRLRRTMAKELLRMDAIMAAIEGPDGSTLIKHRNTKAFEVLARELDAGRRELGIFYGAAHLGDMQERLLRALGFTPESRRWLVAWRLTEAAVEPPTDVDDLRSQYGADGRP
jgi:hypothetical protein